MKKVIAIFCVVGAMLQMAVADIPAAFDPRSQTQEVVEGCGIIIQPMPLTADYLIITEPEKDNPDGVFFTYLATVDVALKPQDFVGKFVLIKAERLKASGKGEASFRITSIEVIRKT